jgi:hypothetical protein
MISVIGRFVISLGDCLPRKVALVQCAEIKEAATETSRNPPDPDTFAFGHQSVDGCRIQLARHVPKRSAWKWIEAGEEDSLRGAAAEASWRPQPRRKLG